MTHKEQVERTLLKFFAAMSMEERRKVLSDAGTDYGRFMGCLQAAWDEKQDLPDKELLRERLKLVRAHCAASRLGKTGRLFTLRHWPEARKLKEQGATYREIAEYLRAYRRFKISPAYLRRLMEAMA